MSYEIRSRLYTIKTTNKIFKVEKYFIKNAHTQKFYYIDLTRNLSTLILLN